MKVILASTSPFRQQQLTELGVEFETMPPDFDEEGFKSKSECNNKKLCLLLGQKKAESLVPAKTNDLIIGSDQMLVLEGQRLNKPKSLNEVIDRLKRLNNKTHTLLTSLFIYTPQKTYTHIDETTLSMKNLSVDEIISYAELDQPIGCAGGYKYELNGKKLFKHINSQDPSSIVGLPTLALIDILKEAGYDYDGLI